MSISLKRLIRKKQRLNKCTKRYNSDTKWKEYKDINKQVRNQIRQQHTNYLSTQYFPMAQIVKSSSGDTLKLERKLTSLLIVSSLTPAAN